MPDGLSEPGATEAGRGVAPAAGPGLLADASTRTRWIASGVFAFLAVATLSATLVGAWADRVLLNEDRFSARIASTLRQDEMNQYLATELTTQVLARAPELLGVRPAIEAVLSEALRTRTAVVGARTALREAHRGVRSGVAEESISIDLAAVYTLAAALMQRGAPDVADRFEAGLDTTRLDAAAVGLRTGLFERLENLAMFRLPLAILALVLFAGTITVAPRRRGGALIAAAALTLTGVAGLLGQRLAEQWFVELLPAREDARLAVTLAWRSMLQEYRGWNAAVIALGLAAAVGVLASGRLPDRPTVRAFVARSTWGRTTIGIALAVAGLAVARWPIEAVRVIVATAGVVVAGAGVLLLLRSALTSVQGMRAADYAERVRAARLLLTAYAVMAVFVIGASLSIWFATTLQFENGPVEAAPIGVCNGSALLCDRPLAEVTFPGTHNSMAAASERGWFYPSQRYGIPQQLRDGVRALLIDTYYGIASPQGVLTVDYDARRPELVARHGEEVVAAAERIASTLRGDGERGIFLCHSFCELGATPLGAVLVDIRDYLDAHPGEFLVVIIQDLTSPADTVAEFELADLSERAYAHVPGEPWPTLGELLAEGKQLLVMAEREAGAASWYLPAYDITATDEDFPAPAMLGDTELSSATFQGLGCDVGRGTPAHPLFMMNHWTGERPSLPSLALGINTADVILNRARGCSEEWGRLPNIVAVDFYDVGDLFASVDALNGVTSEEEARSGQ